MTDDEAEGAGFVVDFKPKVGLTKDDARRKELKKNPKNIIFGKGLVKVGRQYVEVDETKPSIKASETYVPFGRFILNHHRLNQDVILIRASAVSPAHLLFSMSITSLK